MEIKIYEQPRLTQSLEQGQIIEALPRSHATQTIFKRRRIMDSPTNVFGYVRGIINREEPYSFESGLGNTLIERVYPFGGDHMDDTRHQNLSHNDWTTEKQEVYLAIGEIRELEIPYDEDEFSECLRAGSLKLCPWQTEKLRNQLIDYTRERGKKELTFTPTEIRPYKIEEIILELREKKE